MMQISMFTLRSSKIKYQPLVADTCVRSIAILNTRGVLYVERHVVVSVAMNREILSRYCERKTGRNENIYRLGGTDECF